MKLVDLKRGDKVRIKKDLDVDMVYGGKTFVTSMARNLGKTVTIFHVSEEFITIYEDNCYFMPFRYTLAMIEDAFIFGR